MFTPGTIVLYPRTFAHAQSDAVGGAVHFAVRQQEAALVQSDSCYCRDWFSVFWTQRTLSPGSTADVEPGRGDPGPSCQDTMVSEEVGGVLWTMFSSTSLFEHVCIQTGKTRN